MAFIRVILEYHFSIIATAEAEKTAQLINNLMCNDEIRLYLVFIAPTTSLCCSSVGQPKFSSILKLVQPILDINAPKDLYESQWRKMPFVPWRDYFGEDVGTNLILFWSKVFSYQDAAGSKPFEELAELILNMLSVLTSKGAYRVAACCRAEQTDAYCENQCEKTGTIQISTNKREQVILGAELVRAQS